MAEKQSSLSSFKKQLDDQLTCSACLDQYTNPKTLPCLHSFCFECIQQLPVETKDEKHYISCPTCHVNHQIPQGGAINFPNDFKINNLLDLWKRSTISITNQQTTSTSNCSKHNDSLNVYCETCCQVICCGCTTSEEHNTHNFSLISECYPKHHQQIQDSLEILKQKTDHLNTAVTHLAIKESEVLQQGQQLKEQINTHTQQIIDQVQRSCTHLSQQVDTIVQQKTQVLTTQRQQAQEIHTQLRTCQEMIEYSLKEWTKQQILTEKHTMMDEMNEVTQHVDAAMLQPMEQADIQFARTNTTEIGLITTPEQSSTTAQPHDGSLSSMLSSRRKSSVISSTTAQPYDGSLSSMLSSRRKSGVISTTQHQLMGPVGDDDSPFTFPEIHSSPEMRGKTAKITTGVEEPTGIAVSDIGDIVVAERSTHCITILNRKRRFFGTKKGKFIYPCAVAFTNNGLILVTDNHRLHKLTTDGVYVKPVGSSNSGSGQLQFNYPQGITVHPTTGQIFVADSENNRIQVFTYDLTFSHTITLHGDEQFYSPYDIALDKEGYLYAAEFGNHCITKLTTTGQYITRFGSNGFAPGQLSCPSSITISNALVYVSEYDNHRVSVFDNTGKFLHCFGKRGIGKGEFNEPRYIAMDNSHNLYIRTLAITELS